MWMNAVGGDIDLVKNLCLYPCIMYFNKDVSVAEFLAINSSPSDLQWSKLFTCVAT